MVQKDNALISLRAQIAATAQLDVVVQTTLAQLLHAHGAMENSFTCLSCMSLYSSPVILHPCGHTYCKQCVVVTNGNARCTECEDAGTVVDTGTVTSIPCQVLDVLSGNFTYTRQVLSQLQTDFSAVRIAAQLPAPTQDIS